MILRRLIILLLVEYMLRFPIIGLFLYVLLIFIGYFIYGFMLLFTVRNILVLFTTVILYF